MMEPHPGPAFLPPPLHLSLPHRPPTRPPHRPLVVPFPPSCSHPTDKQQQPALPTRRLLLQAAAFTLFPHLLPPTHASARCLPEGDAGSALRHIAWPPSWPYTASDFARFDERPDDIFYSTPRLVRHIDAGAVAALSAYYTTLLSDARDVLDVCASLEAYLPSSWPGKRTVAGVGMNAEEMKRNPALTEFVVRDLNGDTRLPYGDDSFDLVICNVSIDYLTQPLDVTREMRRVLRKDGKVVVSFSDRVFGTKAVALWMRGGDVDHVLTVASYLHFAEGFSQPMVSELTPRKGGKCTGDPLYVVQATKL